MGYGTRQAMRMYPKRSVRSLHATGRRSWRRARRLWGVVQHVRMRLTRSLSLPVAGLQREHGRAVPERTARSVFLLLTHEEQGAMCTAPRYLLIVACSNLVTVSLTYMRSAADCVLRSHPRHS